MARTPDRTPGASDEEEIVLEAQGSDPSTVGSIRFNGTSFRFLDATGVYDPRSGSGVANVGADTDFLLGNEPPEPDNNYAVTYTGSKVSQETWTRVGGNLLRKIDYVYSGNRVSTENIRVYALDGTTVVGHLQVAYTYSGTQLASAVRSRIV